MEKYAFYTDTTSITREQFIQLIVSKEPLHKKKVLRYISGEDHNIGYTTQPMYDKLNGEECLVFYEPDGKWYTRTDNRHYDGKYYWYETDIYNLEKYNIMPSDEFVQYVLDKVEDDE